MPQRMAEVKEQEPSKASRTLKSAALRALLARHDSKRDILATLDLEDTPENLAPFAIERSRGVILTSVVSVRGVPPCFYAGPRDQPPIVQIQSWLTLFISGVHYVGTQRRQIQVQPGAKTKDRPTEAYARTAAARSKGTGVSRRHRTCAAAVGVGVNSPLLALPLPVSIARTQAIRELTPPSRDSEGHPAEPKAIPTSLDDLLKEELR